MAPELKANKDIAAWLCRTRADEQRRASRGNEWNYRTTCGAADFQVLRAVGNTGLALEHAAWELRDDEEAGNATKHVYVCADCYSSLVQVVQLAVRCTGLALEFASDRTGGLKRKTKNKACRPTSHSALSRLKSLREIVMESVGQDGCAIMLLGHVFSSLRCCHHGPAKLVTACDSVAPRRG